MNSAPGGYLALLRTPHVTPLFAWAALARLQFGVIPLALLLLFAMQRHSYAEAGVATAAYGLTAGLLGPLRARAADRCGHGRTLAVLALVNGLGLLAMGALATSALPVLTATGLLAGGLAPPTGPVMRSAWRDLTYDETQLQEAFSLDSVAEEVLFVLGPLLAGAAIARFDARAVLGVSVGLLVLANLGMGSLLGRATSAARRQSWGGVTRAGGRRAFSSGCCRPRDRLSARRVRARRHRRRDATPGPGVRRPACGAGLDRQHRRRPGLRASHLARHRAASGGGLRPAEQCGRGRLGARDQPAAGAAGADHCRGVVRRPGAGGLLPAGRCGHGRRERRVDLLGHLGVQRRYRRGHGRCRGTGRRPWPGVAMVAGAAVATVLTAASLLGRTAGTSRM
ncbi:MAG: MFS transporter [Kineosporiaceae bacterium]|nr:MFS transporter [Kineosporiaceae bacterium]